MKITFLGTGTSQGIPIIGCNCEVCTSPDPKNNRLRVSVLIETPEANIVIDSGPDFRYQMLRAKVKKLDAIIFTHGHKDHVAGLDDIRAYNYFQQKPMDLYATEETQTTLRREFSYIFENSGYPGIPQIHLHTIINEPFYINGLKIIPIKVWHHKLEVFGYRIGDFSYITDVSHIDAKELEKVKGSKVFALSALRHEPHLSHFTLSQALEVAAEAGAEETYFTHIGHQLGLHAVVEGSLPPHRHLAYDNLSITL